MDKARTLWEEILEYRCEGEREGGREREKREREERERERERDAHRITCIQVQTYMTSKREIQYNVSAMQCSALDA